MDLLGSFMYFQPDSGWLVEVYSIFEMDLKLNPPTCDVFWWILMIPNLECRSFLHGLLQQRLRWWGWQSDLWPWSPIIREAPHWNVQSPYPYVWSLQPICLMTFIWFLNPRFDGLAKNPLSFILQFNTPIFERSPITSCPITTLIESKALIFFMV